MNKNQAQLMDDYGKNAIGIPELPSEPTENTPYSLQWDGEKWEWKAQGGE